MYNYDVRRENPLSYTHNNSRGTKYSMNVIQKEGMQIINLRIAVNTRAHIKCAPLLQNNEISSKLIY